MRHQRPASIQHRAGACARRGFTLMEVMVVVAIMGLMLAIGVPTMTAVLDLQQRSSVKELAQTYSWLMDEAALRNVTFRIAFNLDRNTWKVEAGDPTTLIFGTPEEREDWDEEISDKMSRYTQREIEEGALQDVEEKTGRFGGLSDPAFTTEQTLAGDSRFEYVYTPQYGEDGLRATKGGPPEDPEEDRIAYSYVFPDGSAEHTVVRIVDEDDEDDGYTLEIAPLSGEIHLSSELVNPEDSLKWLPEDGPEIR